MMIPRATVERMLSWLCLVIYMIAVTVGTFVGGLWAALGISFALILFIAVAATERTMPLPAPHFAYLALAALVFFAAEIPFSAYPALSLKTWAQLATIFLPLLLLTSARLQQMADRKLLTPVACAAAVGACALGIELQSGGMLLHWVKNPAASLSEYNRGMAHLVILSFPLLAGLWMAGKKYAAAGLLLTLLYPAELTDSHTAKLALLVGVLCALAAAYRPLWIRNILGGLSVFLLGWPFYAQCYFALAYDSSLGQWRDAHPSWWHRLEIWDYLSYRILDRPWFGWGLGTTHRLDFMQPHGGSYMLVTQAAPHAHNFITELWVETGVGGLALGLVFMLLSLRAASRLHPALRPFALGGWAAAVTVAMFGFDFWTDALWAAFALSAFAFGILQQSLDRRADRADF